MAAEFVALADLLRAPVASVAATASPSRSAADDGDERDAGGERDGQGPQTASRTASACAALAAVRDARLFRARLADAFDDAAARLLRELASDVLARELRLAPCDLAAIVQRIGARAPVVRVRVAACDVAGGAPLPRGGGVVFVEDLALARGDAIVELAGGALDARLGVRLATVLEAFA